MILLAPHRMIYGAGQINGRGRSPPTTEDRILIRKLLEGYDLFAVFDGHAGAGVVNLTVELLPRRIQAALEAAAAAADTRTLTPTQVEVILRTAFLEHDKELARQAVKSRDSGSTASVAIITPSHIIMAWVGDSPAFLMNPLTGLIEHEIGKHEPTLAAESARIQRAGGTVEIDEDGTPRVDGSLMVSRAFGDFVLKFTSPPPADADWTKMKVTALPDTAVWERPAHGVLAIMSDGLVETPGGHVAKPHTQVAAEIYAVMQVHNYNLPFTVTNALKRHVAAFVGSSHTKYDGDDLSLVLVDVGLRKTDAATVQQEGGAARAAAVAAAAARVRTRKVRQGRRNKTGKRGLVRVTHVLL